MSSQTTTALIGVFAALCGTSIGGLITYLTNKDLKKKEWSLSLLREEINHKKELYSEFITECYRLSLYSTENTCDSASELNALNRYFSQIELISSVETSEKAKRIVHYLVNKLFEDNNKERKEETKAITFYHLKNNFIEVAKKEIEGIKGS